MRFDTFEQVKAWYESTKPIISKNHTALDDIRPLNERRYKWERIVKLSDNKYAIVDGSWSPLTYNTQSAAERDFNNEVIEKMGTILWEKRDDGEYIHIRGCANGGYSISRYKLLDYNLPWTLRHIANTRQGGHWIEDRCGESKRYKLPKMKCRADWQNKTLTTYEDNSLTFKRLADNRGETIGWERVGTVHITGTTLNLDRKKELKPHLKSFYEWLTTMQPLIPTDWESNRDFQRLMAEGLGIDSFWSGRNTEQITPEFALQVITDEDNQYRLAFAATLLRWIEVRGCPNKHEDKYNSYRNEDGTWGYEEIAGEPFTEEETAAWYVKENKRIKASYNRYMNKLLGLFQQVTV